MTSQCVGCGFCCIKAMCTAGVSFYRRRVKRCPYLVWFENRYWCKLVQDGLVSKHHLHIGTGCTSTLNTWRKDVKKR
jgi:hypothetical protein